MKKVTVNAGRMGLVFKDTQYRRLLTEGAYWLWPFENLVEYDMFKPFNPSVELTLLLNDPLLEKWLNVIEVKNNEIVLQYENGNFKNVLIPGRYAFWKGYAKFSFITADLNTVEISELVDPSILQKRELLPYIRVYQVETYEKGILYKDGKFERILEPGTYFFWKNGTVLSLSKADLRQLQMEISGQEILTRDKAATRVNFFVQYKVTDLMKALNENKEFEKQLYLLAQFALREYIGMLSMDELLEKKESVSEMVMNTLRDKAERLGVIVIDCGIKDIILPGEIKDIMNQVLVAQKQAQANLITRREETAATRSLLNTAKLLEENSMLYKLKEMEYVEKIAEKISTISLSGGNQLVDQLKDIFIPAK